MTEGGDIFVKNFEIPRASYHLMLPVIESFQNSQRILFGEDGVILTRFFWVFEGADLTGAYFVKRELRQLVAAILEAIRKNPEVIEKIHTETYALNDEYFQTAKDILKEDVSALDDVALAEHLENLFSIQLRSHQHSLTTTWFVDSDGEDLSKLLLKKTEQYVQKARTTIPFAQAFSMLTTAPKSSFMQEEELDILRILNRIRNDAAVRETFMSMKEFASVPHGVPDDIRALIEEHVAKWRWFPFTYMGPAYTLEHYLETIAGRIREGGDFDAEMLTIAQRPESIRRQREALFKELGIHDADRRLYDLGAEIAHLKGYRKECMYHGFYALDTLLREAGRRKYLSFEQLHIIPHEDLISALRSGSEIDIDEVNERKEKTVIVYEYGQTFKILTKQDAHAFLDQQAIEEIEVDITADVFYGTCACSGKAEGVVRIVNEPADMPKMQQGDIMISHTTYPSLVPAMKKAAAIVTEDGGVTCHAAIVSRELGTPCLTGVRIATKVFKDGDRVEVDAEKGIVKKL